MASDFALDWVNHCLLGLFFFFLGPAIVLPAVKHSGLIVLPFDFAG